MRGRVLIVGDMNAHSNMWNPHYQRKQNTGSLESLIKRYELIVNNDTSLATHSSSQTISIIDLGLTNPKLGPLHS